MAPRNIRSLVMVVLALIAASLASAPAQAQGNSRTFPETGKTIIDVYDTGGQQLATIAAGKMSLDLSHKVKIPADGMYVLGVQSKAAGRSTSPNLRRASRLRLPTELER